MAKQIALEIELNGDKQVLRSMNDMNDAAEQLRMQMESATDPQDIKRFGRELQKVEGHVKDIELQFESLDVEQRMTAATDVVAGLAGGFAAVEGAIAIAGVESEAFEETMTKVMGAMAFATGVRDLGNMVVAMQKLGVVTKIQTALQAAFNAVANVNPLFLIGTIVVGAITLLLDKLGFLTPIFNAIGKAVEGVVGFVKDLVGDVVDLVNTVGGLLQGVSLAEQKAAKEAEKRRKAEIKAHKERIKELDKEIDALGDQIDQIRKGREAVELRYDREIELARAAGKDTTRLEGEKLDETIERVRKEIIALEERYRVEQERVRETAELTKKLASDSNVIMRNIYETLQDGREQMVSIRAKEVSETKNMLDDLLHDREVHEAEVFKAQSDAARKAQEERDKAAEERAKKEEEEREARIQALKDEHQRMLDIENEFRKEQQRIRDEEQKKREEGAKMQQEFYASLAAMGEEEEKKKIEAQEELLTRMTEARLRYEVGVVSTLQNVAKIIGEESEKGAKLAKAAAIIQVLIDTAKALSSAIAGAVAAASLTGPAGPFIMGSYIAAGVATVTGAFAQVKSILGKADANMPSLGSATAGATGGARINPVQSGNTQIDANGNSIQDTQEMKVHVVESEISEVQGRVSVIENQAAAR